MLKPRLPNRGPLTGRRVLPEELPAQELIPPAGDVALRVIATMPATWGVFKLDQLVASVARETLWVTDAYFVGVSAYINALIAASQDGVDVRLLVPGHGRRVRRRRHEPRGIPRACSKAASASSSGTA